MIAQVITLSPDAPPRVHDASAAAELDDDEMVWVDVIQPDTGDMSGSPNASTCIRWPCTISSTTTSGEAGRLGNTSFGVLYAVDSGATRGRGAICRY